MDPIRLKARFYLSVCMLLLCGFPLFAPSYCWSADKPNIVFILADDLGWSDTTLFGTTKLYETPGMERLAKRGMTFTHAYAASPLCSPTRAAILTGLNPARTNLTAPNCHLPQVVLKATPGKQGPPTKAAVPVSSVTRLDPKYYTLTEALKDEGYATGHFGKWHLGAEPYSPLEHGFDVDIPHWPGPGPAGSFVAPWKYVDFDPATPNEHIEDRMANEAVAFMEAHRDEPFFLNYWMFSVHAPFDAKPDLIEKYKGKVDSNDPQRSPTYAAMIESMDDAVGTLLDAIDRLGMTDNTIIVFASDNGGNMYNWVDETTPTSNAPLRGGKATMYEGGVRGPATVVWPGHIAADSRSDEVIQSCDFYPTLLEMINRQPKPNQTFDGISIMPALEGKTLDRESIFTYFPHSPGVPDWLPPAVSVHHGDWKLIRLFHGAGSDGQHRWKLFNLAKDIGETNDLAAQQPDRVKELDALIEQFLVDTESVQPIANPAFDPAKFKIENEGKAEPHGKTPGKANGKKSAGLKDPIAGWQANKDCKAQISNGKLVITSHGKDPFVTFKLPKPAARAALELRVTMRSDLTGGGQLYWREAGKPLAYKSERSVEFDVKSDGQSHQYRVPFKPDSKVISIRFDPGRAAGEAEVSSMSVVNAAGETVYDWKF